MNFDYFYKNQSIIRNLVSEYFSLNNLHLCQLASLVLIICLIMPIQKVFSKPILNNDISLLKPILPIKGSKNVSSIFGHRLDPFSGFLKDHKGIDYVAKIDTPIVATEAGKVLRASYVRGYGNLVEIDHGFGITSRYGHSSQLLVQVGQIVQKGQVIALVGNTGYSTGSHLHFEISRYGLAINPLDFINKGLQDEKNNQTNKYLIHNKQTQIENSGFDQNNIKPYFFNGEMIVAVKVRSGKSIKW